ncbi:MAG: hypothetical protein IJM30_02520 [Thermoguttaceae bacterium]|nr:hypothetical protein [Thermoguttaceae bacterium]
MALKKYEPLSCVAEENDPNPPKPLWGDLYRVYHDETQRSLWRMKFKFSGDELWNLVPVQSKIKSHMCVRIVDEDKQENSIYTEEFGESLFAYVDRTGSPSQTAIRNFLADSLQMLAEFEKKKFVHGDIDPKMFFLPPDWTPPKRLTHFPVKLYVSLGPIWDGALLAPLRKPKYAAPELFDARFGDVTPKSDLFSLAFATLELLTEKNPKTGEGFNSFFSKDFSGVEPSWLQLRSSQSFSLPPLEKMVPRIAPDLKEALTQALERDPAKRPSPLDVLDMLNMDAQSEPIDDSDEESEEYYDENEGRIFVGDLQSNLSTFGGRSPLTDPGFTPFDEEEEEEKPSFAETAKKFVKKPYFTYPVVALSVLLVLLAAVGAIADRLADQEFYIYVNDRGYGDSKDNLHYIPNEFASLVKLEGEREIPVDKRLGYWRLPSKRAQYQMKLEGCEPFQFSFERKGRKNLLINGVPSKEIKLTSKATITVSLRGNPPEGSKCVFNGLEYSCDDDKAWENNPDLLAKIDARTYRFPAKSGRFGVYKSGYYPQKPTDFAENATRASVPLPAPPNEDEPSETLDFSQDVEDLSLEIYRLFCAIPAEWKRFDSSPELYVKVFPGWNPPENLNVYDAIFEEYVAELGDRSPKLESVRAKLLVYCEQIAMRVLDEKPFRFEQTPSGLWAKTRDAMRFVADKICGKEVEMSRQFDENLTVADYGVFWKAIVDERDAVEAALRRGTISLHTADKESKDDTKSATPFYRIRKDSLGFASSSSLKPGDFSEDDLSKFGIDRVFLAARIVAQRAFVESLCSREDGRDESLIDAWELSFVLLDAIETRLNQNFDAKETDFSTENRWENPYYVAYLRACVLARLKRLHKDDYKRYVEDNKIKEDTRIGKESADQSGFYYAENYLFSDKNNPNRILAELQEAKLGVDAFEEDDYSSDDPYVKFYLASANLLASKEDKSKTWARAARELIESARPKDGSLAPTIIDAFVYRQDGEFFPSTSELVAMCRDKFRPAVNPNGKRPQKEIEEFLKKGLWETETEDPDLYGIALSLYGYDPGPENQGDFARETRPSPFRLCVSTREYTALTVPSPKKPN